MKTILSAALVLGLCGLAGAADEKADPVGTWKCEYEIGGQKRTSTLTIKKDGDKLAGTMSWPDQKETKLKDVKLKDGDLTFSAEREFMDNKIHRRVQADDRRGQAQRERRSGVRGREAGVRHRGEAGEEGQVAVDTKDGCKPKGQRQLRLPLLGAGGCAVPISMPLRMSYDPNGCRDGNACQRVGIVVVDTSDFLAPPWQGTKGTGIR